MNSLRDARTGCLILIVGSIVLWGLIIGALYWWLT